MSRREYLNAPVDVIAPSLIGSCLTELNEPPREIPSYHQFYKSQPGSINVPEHIRGEWLLSKMESADQLNQVDVPDDIVKQVFRPDIYHEMHNKVAVA